jgi:hypothetical protein
MPADGNTAVARSPLRGDSLSARIAALRTDAGPILGTVVLPFALVLYLALEGGGYDEVVRGEIGIAVWWIVLLGALVGALPQARLTPASWAGVAVLCAFAAWTGLGISWSDSNERSVVELARVATLAGVLVLALSVQGRDGLRRTVYSVGAALGAVAVLALLSRLHPSWFPHDDASLLLKKDQPRLNYPVNYWNGLAAMMAIGIPLLLAVATEARRLVAQALAIAAVPVMALVAYYTLSRGGAGETAIALVVLVLLYPRRLALLPSLLLGAIGGALLVGAATQRDALESALSTHAASTQGDEMLVMTIVVCAGVALVRVAFGLAAQHGIGPRARVGRAGAFTALALGLCVAVVAFFAAGGPSEVSDAWHEFKKPGTPAGDNSSARFQSASGNGRYQLWETAVDAYKTDPMVGIGPGTYEQYWAEHGNLPTFVRDAHSLFLESLAELGIIGLVLIGSLVFGLLGYGIVRSIAGSPAVRPWVAAGTAAMAAFAAAAAIDWAWELTVIPVVFLLLAGALLAERGPAAVSAGPAPIWSRAVLGVLALGALVAIAIPLAGTSQVRASEDNVDAGRLGAALGDARDATDLEPWAGTPLLQQALVLERQGNLDDAAAAARAATHEEPQEWRNWLVLSRIEAYRNRPAASVKAYKRARSLNPRSQLFAR